MTSSSSPCWCAPWRRPSRHPHDHYLAQPQAAAAAHVSHGDDVVRNAVGVATPVAVRSAASGAPGPTFAAEEPLRRSQPPLSDSQTGVLSRSAHGAMQPPPVIPPDPGDRLRVPRRRRLAGHDHGGGNGGGDGPAYPAPAAPSADPLSLRSSGGGMVAAMKRSDRHAADSLRSSDAAAMPPPSPCFSPHRRRHRRSPTPRRDDGDRGGADVDHDVVSVAMDLVAEADELLASFDRDKATTDATAAAFSGAAGTQESPYARLPSELFQALHHTPPRPSSVGDRRTDSPEHIYSGRGGENSVYARMLPIELLQQQVRRDRGEEGGNLGVSPRRRYTRQRSHTVLTVDDVFLTATHSSHVTGTAADSPVRSAPGSAAGDWLLPSPWWSSTSSPRGDHDDPTAAAEGSPAASASHSHHAGAVDARVVPSHAARKGGVASRASTLSRICSTSANTATTTTGASSSPSPAADGEMAAATAWWGSSAGSPARAPPRSFIYVRGADGCCRAASPRTRHAPLSFPSVHWAPPPPPGTRRLSSSSSFAGAPTAGVSPRVPTTSRCDATLHTEEVEISSHIAAPPANNHANECRGGASPSPRRWVTHAESPAARSARRRPSITS